MRRRFISTYSRAYAANFVPVDFTGNLVQSWNEARCDALAWPKEVLTRDASSVAFLCAMDLASIELLMQMSIAFPASELAPALSYYIA
jgi:hypothetical protein